MQGLNPEHHAELLAMLHQLYLARHTPCIEALAELPGVSQDALAHLCEQLGTDKGLVPTSKYTSAGDKRKVARNTLKDFLKVCAGAKIEPWKRPPSVSWALHPCVLVQTSPRQTDECVLQRRCKTVLQRII